MIFLNMDPEMVEHEGTQRATNITKLVPPANGQTVGFHTGATSQVVGGSTPDICALRKLNPLRIQDLPSLDPNSSDISRFTPQTPINVTRLKKRTSGLSRSTICKIYAKNFRRVQGSGTLVQENHVFQKTSPQLTRMLR